MLSEIRELIKERDSVSLSDLAIRFRVEESALEKMMEMLTRQGTVVKEKTECRSGSRGCCGMSSCRPSGAVSYRWAGRSARPGDSPPEQEIPSPPGYPRTPPVNRNQ